MPRCQKRCTPFCAVDSVPARIEKAQTFPAAFVASKISFLLFPLRGILFVFISSRRAVVEHYNVGGTSNSQTPLKVPHLWKLACSRN